MINPRMVSNAPMMKMDFESMDRESHSAPPTRPARPQLPLVVRAIVPMSGSPLFVVMHVTRRCP